MNIDEDKLAAEIHSKLKSDPSISYSEIANKALDAGRKKLALSVINRLTNFYLRLRPIKNEHASVCPS